MTTTPPEYPYCVTITKPGLPTVHLGYPLRSQAEIAAASLIGQMVGTAHPEGTQITLVPAPTDLDLVPPVIPTVGWLVQAMAQEAADRPAVWIEGEQFPDLYARLRAQEPYETASQLWQAACDLLGQGEAEDDNSPVAETTDAHGVTAGYDVDRDTWHVEIHLPGQPVEIVRIVAPSVPDQETARTLAEQIAAHRKLPHLEDNRGIIPASDMLDRLRAALWMAGEDDPTLLEEARRLHDVDQAAVNAGWAQVAAVAKATESTKDRVDCTVYRNGNHRAVAAMLDGVAVAGVGIYSAEDARAFAADLLAAALRHEQLMAAAMIAETEVGTPPTEQDSPM